MNHPYFEKREEYKSQIYDIARKNLNLDNWKKDQIGSGEIAKNVIKAIEINENRLRNNLVQWQPKYGEKNTKQYKIKKSIENEDTQEIEQILFNLFQNEKPDEVSFQTMIDFLGKKYDIIAYFFFLKNKRKYLPIATRYFDKIFEILEISVKTTRQCSWKNYLEFITVNREVQFYLQEKFSEDVSLLDAHSLLWSLALEEYTIEERGSRNISFNELELKSIENKTKNKPSVKPKIRKIDFEKVNMMKASNGKIAESIVLEHEKKYLIKHGKLDLSKKVSDDPSYLPSLGYDIDSYELDGTPKQIEVKSLSNGDKFYITRNELERSKSLENYYLYLVIDGKTDFPLIEYKKQPDFLDPTLFNMIPENYQVKINRKK